MTTDVLIQIAQESIYVLLIVLAPLLGVALLVGLIISVFQAATQIQEQTLAFVPKIVAVFASLLVFGPWIMIKIVGFTRELFESLPKFAGM